MGGGAWGLGLLQSDYDYDIIQDLSEEAGLWRLEEGAAKVENKVSVYTDAIRKAEKVSAKLQVMTMVVDGSSLTTHALRWGLLSAFSLCRASLKTCSRHEKLVSPLRCWEC